MRLRQTQAQEGAPLTDHCAHCSNGNTLDEFIGTVASQNTRVVIKPSPDHNPCFNLTGYPAYSSLGAWRPIKKNLLTMNSQNHFWGYKSENQDSSMNIFFTEEMVSCQNNSPTKEISHVPPTDNIIKKHLKDQPNYSEYSAKNSHHVKHLIYRSSSGKYNDRRGTKAVRWSRQRGQNLRVLC